MNDLTGSFSEAELDESLVLRCVKDSGTVLEIPLPIEVMLDAVVCAAVWKPMLRSEME